MHKLFFQDFLLGSVKYIPGLDFPWNQGQFMRNTELENEELNDFLDLLIKLTEKAKTERGVGIPVSSGFSQFREYWDNEKDWKIISSNGEIERLIMPPNIEVDGRITWRSVSQDIFDEE